MKKILLLLFVFACTWCSLSAQRVKVACVGNSVTYGMTIENREHDCYPAQLGRMLGDGFDVRNFGHNGATLLRRGYNPYMKLPEFREAMDFQADVYVIHLGLNDTDPRNWPHLRDEFLADYYALIDSFLVANPKAQIYVCRMTPIFPGHPRFTSGTRDWHAQIQALIEQVASARNLPLIDLYEPLHKHPDLFPDNLHPKAKGAGILAKTVYDALTGHRDAGLQLPMLYTDGLVLQRHVPLALQGKTSAGASVEVEFRGELYQTQALADGSFCITLPAQEAGGPFELTFRAVSAEAQSQAAAASRRGGSRKKVLTPALVRTLHNVWVGEVFICSGQSNMEYQVCELRGPEADFHHAMDADTASMRRVHFFTLKPSRQISTDAPWDSLLMARTQDLDFYNVTPWAPATEQNVGAFSAIGYMAARMLADSLGLHIGVVQNAVGGAPCESFVERGALEREMPGYFIFGRPAKNDYLQDWVRRCIEINTRESTYALPRHPYDPSYLYEAGVQPLQGYAVRGVWWYQGCSNAHNSELHDGAFRLLVDSWRQTFPASPVEGAASQPLPFFTVQLSGISTRPAFPAFRVAQQRLSQEIDGVHLVVSSDAGDPTDIHPWRKSPIAARLAHSVLHHVLGREDLPADAPTALRATVAQDGAVVVQFAGTGGYLAADATHDASRVPHYPLSAQQAASRRAQVLAADQPVQGFEICGADGIFHPASAVIPSAAPETVRLICGEVSAPQRVRYAWRPDPADANLYSAAWLPVATFEIAVADGE